MKQHLNVILPVAVVFAFAAWAVSMAVRPVTAEVRPPAGADPAVASGAFDLEAFGRLPVVYQGRVKPWDTLARNSLMIVSDRQTFVEKVRDPKNRELVIAEVRQPAIKWLLDIIARQPQGMGHEVFRIENDDVLDALGLRQRAGFRYALSEFTDEAALRRIETDSRNADQKSESEQTLYDKKIVELAKQIGLVSRLIGANQPPDFTDAQAISDAALRYQTQVAPFEPVHAVAPASRDADWAPFLPSLLRGAMARNLDPNTQSLYLIFDAYKRGDAAKFNSEVAAYRGRLALTFPELVANANAEVVFNRAEPFYAASVMYGFVFVLVCLGWLFGYRPLPRSAAALLVLAFTVHTVGLIVRMVLQGRPPVTNLYSSAVFIGWGAVVVALILEYLYRNGVGTLLGAVIGCLTLIVAHGLVLAQDRDTLEMMQAVLDTNFWLATHVTCVTLGYTAVFLAGFLAAGYILAGFFTPLLNKPWGDSALRLSDPAYKVLGRMIYGVLCFAVFLSFTGTVLGGIWADQSWGRFWGWDTKENGALMIVLWTAMILHARWGGMVKQRGIAVLAVLGNVIVAWSWFGVNMLGVGLHNYGFMEAILPWLIAFVASQLAIAILGTLPLSMWRSFRESTDDAPAPAHAPAPA